MRRTVAPLLLSLACAAALAGCRPEGAQRGDASAGVSGEASVDAVVRQLDEFTDELARKVESAPDPKAGVAEAQRLLDARKAELSSRVLALKRGALAGDASARGKWLEAEVDNTRRVRELKLKHLDASLRDPELKAALERLAADYDSLYGDR
jgi:hypothetical protein